MSELTLRKLYMSGIEKLKDSRTYCDENILKKNLINVLKCITKFDSLQLLLNMNLEISAKDKIVTQFKDILNKMKYNMPIEYILGETEFMSLKFKVTQDTLIPRPETEKLVEIALNKISKSKNLDFSILDLCSGTGCIGLSIAKYSNSVKRVVGIDISEPSIEVANFNRDELNLNNCFFYKYDLFQGLDNLLSYNNSQKFNLIVSNPPYIESFKIQELEGSVKDFEPHIALDGGSDGLNFYKYIIQNADSVLKKDGNIIFEIGYNQANAVTDLMSSKYTEIEVHRDLFGNDRVVSAVLN